VARIDLERVHPPVGETVSSSSAARATRGEASVQDGGSGRGAGAGQLGSWRFFDEGIALDVQ
jgi:hypothetical protein